MIDDTDNCVRDGVAIQIVPFAIVPPKLAAVSIASVNPNNATWTHPQSLLSRHHETLSL